MNDSVNSQPDRGRTRFRVFGVREDLRATERFYVDLIIVDAGVVCPNVQATWNPVEGRLDVAPGAVWLPFGDEWMTEVPSFSFVEWGRRAEFERAVAAAVERTFPDRIAELREQTLALPFPE